MNRQHSGVLMRITRSSQSWSRPVRWWRGLSCVTMLLFGGVATGGCGLDFAYLLPAISGQLDILGQVQPVSAALAGDDLDAEQRAKLVLIQDVRRFAEDVVGLAVGDNYSGFYNSYGEPVAFNVSASRMDGFAPRLWSFPIVGTVPYLGYFDRELATAKREELVAEGLDVFVYEIRAYSGLGFYANPILSPMLDLEDDVLVDTVLHELLHATIWRTNDTSFNESLATFVGRTGARRYLAELYPGEPERVAELSARFEDGDIYAEFALGLFEDLDAYYRSDASTEQKIAGREAVFAAGRQRFAVEYLPKMHHPERYDWVPDLPVNNAYMLGIRRYNLELQAFQRVFDATGGDWAASLDVFREAAAAPDAYAFLNAWPTPAAKAEPFDSGDFKAVEVPRCACHAPFTLLARP